MLLRLLLIISGSLEAVVGVLPLISSTGEWCRWLDGRPVYQLTPVLTARRDSRVPSMTRITCLVRAQSRKQSVPETLRV